MRRLLLCACLMLAVAPAVVASRVVLQTLEDMIGSINVIVVGTVRGAEEQDRNRYRYDVEISDCLVGEVATNRLTVSYYEQGSPHVSVISPASGIEHSLQTGARYVLLFNAIEPQWTLGVVLVRAEPVERRDAVLKAWRENREHEKNVGK